MLRKNIFIEICGISGLQSLFSRLQVFFGVSETNKLQQTIFLSELPPITEY